MNARRSIMAIACLAIAVATSACGSRSSDAAAAPDLRAIASSVGSIRSGELVLSFDMSEGRDGTAVGFTMSGPFSLGGDGVEPVADVTLEQTAGSLVTRSGFILAAGKAYAVIDGQTYVLPDDRAAVFEGFTQKPDDGFLPTADLSSWIAEPTVTGEGSIGGDPTQVISGTLRAPEAIGGIVALMTAAGAADAVPPVLDEDDRERLSNAVRDGSIRIQVGADDGILRAIDLEVSLAPEDPNLASLAGVRLAFHMRIERPNEPVQVVAPDGAQELPLP